MVRSRGEDRSPLPFVFTLPDICQALKEVIRPQVPLRTPCYNLARLTKSRIETAIDCRCSSRLYSAGLMGGVCKAQGLIHRAIVTRDYWGFQAFTRVSYNPRSELRCRLGDYLTLSGSELIVCTIVCRVWPRRFGLYRPTVAFSFLRFTSAVALECTPSVEKASN